MRLVNEKTLNNWGFRGRGSINGFFPLLNSGSGNSIYSIALERYRDAGQNSATIFNPLFTTQPILIWCDILLTGSHQFLVVSLTLLLTPNSLYFPFISPLLFFLIRCTIDRVIHYHHYPLQRMVKSARMNTAQKD